MACREPPFDARVRDWFGGTYAEVTNTIRHVAVTPSVRIDRFDHARAVTADPRLNVRLDLGRQPGAPIRDRPLSAGSSSSYFDRERGAARLPPMRAVHYVAGYETGRVGRQVSPRRNLRQGCRRLPLQDAAQGCTADGRIGTRARCVRAVAVIAPRAAWERLVAARETTLDTDGSAKPLRAARWNVGARLRHPVVGSTDDQCRCPRR